MYKTIFNKRNSLKFNRFSNKNYSLFAVLGREVLVGALSVATLSHAKAAGVSTEGAKVDSTLYKGGKAYELDAVPTGCGLAAVRRVKMPVCTRV